MKNRIRNKIIKQSILIYDRASLPKGTNMSHVVHSYRNIGVVLYDSTLGQRPIVYPRKNLAVFKFSDISKSNDRRAEKL